MLCVIHNAEIRIHTIVINIAGYKLTFLAVKIIKLSYALCNSDLFINNLLAVVTEFKIDNIFVNFYKGFVLLVQISNANLKLAKSIAIGIITALEEITVFVIGGKLERSLFYTRAVIVTSVNCRHLADDIFPAISIIHSHKHLVFYVINGKL